VAQPSGDHIPLGGFVHNWDSCDVSAWFKFAITELASYSDLFSTAFYIRQIGLRSCLASIQRSALDL
jgi:hypothetical protein